MEVKHKTIEPVQPDNVFVINDVETLRVVADPLRLRLLDVLRRGPSTVKQLAAVLDVPLKKLYYHINLLEACALIRVVGTRVVSGIIEKQYQVAAYRLSVDRAFLSPASDSWPNRENIDVFLSVVLDHTRSVIKESMQAGLIDPEETSLWKGGFALGRMALRLSPYHAEALHARLVELSREFMALEVDSLHGDVQSYEVLLGIYPTHTPAPLRDPSTDAGEHSPVTSE